MPVESKGKQLALAFLSPEKRPLSPRQLASLLGKADQNKINLARHYLLQFWREGRIIRSEREIGLEYYYFFGRREKLFLLQQQKVRFLQYKDERDSRGLKERIKAILRPKGPLTVKEICFVLNPSFNLAFLKKINFHLYRLFQAKEIRRSSKPYQYFLTAKDEKKITEAKASFPTLLLNILREKKTAFFTSELAEEVKKRIESPGRQPRLSALSLALKRLCRQQLIVSSQTRFGTRSRKTGYLWAIQKEEIARRFRQELPSAIKEILSAEQILVDTFCRVLKISPTNARGWMRRISAELPEFVLEEKKLVKRRKDNYAT